MDSQRQEKALREYKDLLSDLAHLLHQSTGAETVCMHWVNRARKQFVLETHVTTHEQVMFPDRVAFSEHYLYPYIDLENVIHLIVGEEVSGEDLSHYHHEPPPVTHLTLIPFVNNGETVALTVIERTGPLSVDQTHSVLQAYEDALGNLLNTYLELTDLQAKQREWIEYEELLNSLSPRLHRMEILYRMVRAMQKLLPCGGVSLIARGMGVWVNVLNASGSQLAPATGQMIDEGSLAYESLKKGEPVFAVHFNQSPKRVTRDELRTEGATLAIPIMLDDRRHATVIVYSANALAFRESLKHKMVNLVRVASLAIRATFSTSSPDENLLSTSYGTFIPDVWERTVQSSIRSTHPLRSVWLGLVTITNLQELRSRYRLETLSELQKELVTSLNPSRFGRTGYLGFNSDYVYVFLLEDSEDGSPQSWISEANRMLETPLRLPGGEQIQLSLTAGYTRIEAADGDHHPVLQRAKKALSHALNESEVVTDASELAV